MFGTVLQLKRIFLLEDDMSLRRGIAMALESPEVSVIQAGCIGEAESALGAGEQFDLMILDVNLPDGSGLDLLRALRQGGCRTPVMLLTANDMETDIVSGLELGADDYVTKPFSLAVLRARANVQLRGPVPGSAAVELPPFRFDFARMTFERAGKPVELSKTEQRLLRLLVENRGRVLRRELLLDRVWDGGEFVEENALSVAVRRLRAKLVDAPIRTVYGIGYTWEADK